MKRRLAYGLVGLGAYLLFLLLQCPAAPLVKFGADHWPEAVRIGTVQGLARQGRIESVHWGNFKLAWATWEWHWLALLEGRMEVAFTLGGPDLRITGMVGPSWGGGWYFRHLRGELPLVDMVAGLGKILPVTGRVEIDDLTMRIAESGSVRDVQGVLRLAATRLNLADGLSLGDFMASFATRDAVISGFVRDQGGPLRVNGVLTLDPEGRYRFTGSVSLHGDNPILHQTLNWLGAPGPDGVWAIQFSGTLNV